jgi:hypothetical protein
VAIPTDFKGPTPAANTTKSFKVFGSTTVGIWALDIDGTLSATCTQVPIAPNLALLMSAAYTDAQINTLLLDYLVARGARHDGAGGQAAQGTQQAAVVATTCT